MLNKYLISSLLLLILDLLWLKFYMKDKYKKMVFEIQNSELKFNFISAILSYLILCFSLNYFVLPYVKENDIKLLTHSFIFGLVVYGVYDFTCGAIFEKWDKKLMIIDTIWGGFLFMLTNYIINIFFK